MDKVESLSGVLLSSLKIIDSEQGSVLHAIKSSSEGFQGFGEAYFSTVLQNSKKGFKCHKKMLLNLVVPVGEIEFCIVDLDQGKYQLVRLSRANYHRLTIQPGLWMGFKGVGEEESLLVNVANIEHDPKEALAKDLSDPDFEGLDW